MTIVVITRRREQKLRGQSARFTAELENLEVRTFGKAKQRLDITHTNLAFRILRKFFKIAPLLR